MEDLNDPLRYDAKKTLVLPRAAAFSLKGRVKLTKEKHPTPGPKDYPDSVNADKVRFETAPQFTTGFRKPCGNKPKLVETPGPKTYVNISTKLCQEHPGTFSFKSRVKEVKEKPLPNLGPNSFPEVATYKAVGKTGPSLTMLKKFPAPKSSTNEASKLYVSTNLTHDAPPKFSMRGRQKVQGVKEKATLPGPGAYPFIPHQKVGTTGQTFGKGKYSKKVFSIME